MLVAFSGKFAVVVHGMLGALPAETNIDKAGETDEESEAADDGSDA